MKTTLTIEFPIIKDTDDFEKLTEQANQGQEIADILNEHANIMLVRGLYEGLHKHLKDLEII